MKCEGVNDKGDLNFWVIEYRSNWTQMIMQHWCVASLDVKSIFDYSTVRVIFQNSGNLSIEEMC